jgi:hypothetical protein
MTPGEYKDLEIVDSFFNSNILDQVSKFEKKVLEEKQVSLKFNGKLISERYNMKGKELGDFIIRFKKSCSSRQDYYTFIKDTPIDKIWRNTDELFIVWTWAQSL